MLTKTWTQPSSPPRSDSAVSEWLQMIAGSIKGDPAAYDLSPDESVMLASLALEYDAALLIATNAGTRCHNSIAHKDEVRARAVNTFRRYMSQIKADARIGIEHKLALGLHVSDQPRRIARIPAPKTRPILTFEATLPGRDEGNPKAGFHRLRYADSRTPRARCKPHGVQSLELRVALGEPTDPPITDPEQALIWAGRFTITPFKVDLSKWPAAIGAGKTATYFGRWLTRTACGPWSKPLTVAI